MVIHANIDAVSTSTIFLQSNLAPKKYVVVKNHVREINKSNDNTLEKSDNNKEISEEKVKTRKRKSKNSNVNQPLQYTEENDQMNSVAPPQYSEDNDQNSVSGEISKSDLQELRQVYIQCKSVINKIETKYGHLLNLTNERLENEEECICRLNKNVFFNEDGQQFLNNSTFKRHMCYNLKSDQRNLPQERGNLRIEYTSDYYSDLPDSLKDLGNILKDPIDFRLRRNVINKIKGIRQEYMNELKDDKQLLIKKFKENPPEGLLGFEGTNLATISGYPA